MPRRRGKSRRTARLFTVQRSDLPAYGDLTADLELQGSESGSVETPID